jgi:hypothetical protein
MDEKNISEKKEINQKMHDFKERHVSWIKKADGFLYHNPLLKVPLFVGTPLLIYIIMLMIFPSEDIVVKYAKIFIYLFTTIYLLFFVVHLIGKSFKSLLNANNVFKLCLSYTSRKSSDIEKMNRFDRF